MARYTIDFDPTLDKLLESLAEGKGVSKSEVIRRAIASYDYLVRTTKQRPNTKVSITDEQDQVLKDVVLP